MITTKFLALFRLFRFELPFTAGTCVLLGELLALGKLPALNEVVYGFLSVFCISATALILNDYFDVESDKINAPSRPLPAGLVSKVEVIILSVLVALLGFIFSYLISTAAFFVVLLLWFVGLLYNWRFKKFGLLGNLLVSFSVGMTFVFGGIVVGRPFEPIVWFMAMLVLLINLGEEIAADALDVSGDREVGSRSLAVLLGSQNAMSISAGIFFSVMFITLIPFLLGRIKEWIYFVPAAILDLIIFLSTIKLLNPKCPSRLKYIRAIYLGGLVVLILTIILILLL